MEDHSTLIAKKNCINVVLTNGVYFAELALKVIANIVLMDVIFINKYISWGR